MAMVAMGCGPSHAPAATDGGTADAGVDSGGSDAAHPSDPFAAQADDSGGLTNTSADLDAVLEHGALVGACDRYRSGQTDRTTLLLCGKWMFFYESFNTFGVPTAVVSFLAQQFPDELGLGFSKLGMVPDPASAEHLPLGMAPTAPFGGTVPALAFTCASCHFAQLPDGRYSVGAPNHGYDYGRHILTLMLAPTVGSGVSSAAAHDPDAIAKVQPVLDKLASSLTLKSKFLLALVPLASVKLPAIPTAVEHQYSQWVSGTQDFMISPLPVDDMVHVVSKMSALWGIPRADEATASGMSSQLLAWSGDAGTLDGFVSTFAVLGNATPPTADQMKPLLEYIYSLRAPSNPSPPDAALSAQGAALYVEKGCASCHDGPRGSGARVYTFEEIGTDAALRRWADPTLTGDACCGLAFPAGTLKHGVKSPRMVGMWAQRRFLHNGALSSLEQLFCLDGGRPPVGVEPFRSDGHAFTCDGLADSEKRALIAYLLAH